jgi:HPP family
VPGSLGLALLIMLRRRSRLPAADPMAPTALPLEPDPDEPILPPLQLWLGPLALFLAGTLLLGHGLGTPLVLYPPLLVLTWETLARPHHCPWRGRPLAVLTAMTASAGAGWLLVHGLGPQPWTTALAVLTVALLLRTLRLICPPAFAVALLPFVLHQPPPSFPLAVLVGTAWLLLVARLPLARRPPSGGREWEP